MSLARCCGRLWVTLPLVLLRWPGLLLAAERVALVEVFLEQRPAVSAVLQGEVVESGGGGGGKSRLDRDELEGELLLVSHPRSKWHSCWSGWLIQSNAFGKPMGALTAPGLQLIYTVIYCNPEKKCNQNVLEAHSVGLYSFGPIIHQKFCTR